MEESEETAIEETLRILYRDHKKGPDGRIHKDGLAVFIWLVTKSFSGEIIPDTSKSLNIERSQINSTREEKSTKELREIQQSRKCHERDNPQTIDGTDSPIIIVEYEETILLIDGSNRINMWSNNENTDLHRVNFHKIAGRQL